jgi:DNA repair protein RadA
MAKKEKEEVEKTEVDMNDLTQLPGVGAQTAEKLTASRFCTISAIAAAKPGQIIDVIEGLGESNAKKMIMAAKDLWGVRMYTGEEILEREKERTRISTGCIPLDGLVGGGFKTGKVYECYGEFSCSKTQFAHSLCVQTLKTFPDSIVIFIDTENTFSPKRILDFARGAGIDGQEALKKIRVARSYNSDDQMLYAESVSELIAKKKMNIKLVVVDSITAHFRAEFIGRGTLAERQNKIGMHLNTLTQLADINNVLVYVTNQVMSVPDMMFGDPTKPAGGHILAHGTGVRIYLRKGKKGTRVAKVMDSPENPEAECQFAIGDEGFTE